MKNTVRRLLPLFLLTLSVWLVPFHRAVSAADALQWTPVNIPAEGIAGRWTLANGSDIRNLTIAPDGTLYCSANPAGTTFTLFKSTDNGRGWIATGKVTDAIVDIAVLPRDSTTIYYATAARIFKSIDAGNTFTPVPVSPGGAGSGNVCITSIDVVSNGATNTIVVSTVDNDAAQYGGVYLLDESQFVGEWTNTNIGNYDVYRVAFSPDYPDDRQIIALASNEIDTFVTNRLNNGSWGGFIGSVRIPGIVPAAGSLAFPDKYVGLNNNTFFAGIDSGSNKGGVYKITADFSPAPSAAKDLKIGAVDNLNAVDVSGLICSGNMLIAGCARKPIIYLSNDGGTCWTQSSRQPTGQTDTCPVKAPNPQHTLFCATCGADSAISCSSDGGQTWNQISLIDTRISDITDIITPAPATAFILTLNAQTLKQSLWRTTDNGITWDRIFCSSLAGVDNLKLVRAGPQTGDAPPAIIVSGQKSNSPAIWTSNDNGQNFTWHLAPCSTDTLAIVDGKSWFVSAFDGSKNLIYATHNGGNFYTAPVEAGSVTLTALAASPNYQNDRTLLAGNMVGQVYLSQDNGLSFNPVGQPLPLNAGVGKINLTFDSKFIENKIIYADTEAKAAAGARDRIFRFTIGQSTGWLSLCSSLPDNAIVKQLFCANDGTLYALNTEPVVNADSKGGAVRTLNPTSSSPTLEAILAGLDDTVFLSKMSGCGNQLWAIDEKNMRVMTFADNLTSPVTLISPDDKAAGVENSTLDLKWQAVNTATLYEWQVSDNTGFTGIPAGLTGTSDAASTRPAGLVPAAGYYWRVRVSKPLLSRWSDTRSFNTILGGTDIAPSLTVPAAGTKTPVRPLFQWSTIASADKYDLMVAKDASFGKPVIEKTGNNAISSNAWESDVILENDTTYYWRVKARNAASFGTWSAVSAFVTESPVLTTAPPENSQAFAAQQTATEMPPQQTQIVSTVIIQTQTANTPQAITVNLNIPPWIMYVGILLLAVVIIMLALLVVNATRHKR